MNKIIMFCVLPLISACSVSNHSPKISTVPQISLPTSSSSVQQVETLSIEWLAIPLSVQAQEALGKDLFIKFSERLLEQYQDDDMVKEGAKTMKFVEDEFEEKTSWTLLGTVRNDPYQNGKLYQVSIGCFENDYYCIGSEHKVLITMDRMPFFLVQHPVLGSNNEYFLNFTALQARIDNQDMPSSLAIPGTTVPLKLVSNTLKRIDVSSHKKAFMDIKNETQLYFGVSGLGSTERYAKYYGDYADAGCFLAQNRDGSIAFYEFDFSKGEGFPLSKNRLDSHKADGYLPASEGIIDITWHDGSKNIYDYTHDGPANCSGVQPCYTLEQFDENEYEKIGQGSWGGSIYRKRINEKGLASTAWEEESLIGKLYLSLPEDKKGLSFTEFNDEYPVIFIQDPIGRLLEFYRADFDFDRGGCGGSINLRDPQL